MCNNTCFSFYDLRTSYNSSLMSIFRNKNNHRHLITRKQQYSLSSASEWQHLIGLFYSVSPSYRCKNRYTDCIISCNARAMQRDASRWAGSRGFTRSSFQKRFSRGSLQENWSDTREKRKITSRLYANTRVCIFLREKNRARSLPALASANLSLDSTFATFA